MALENCPGHLKTSHWGLPQSLGFKSSVELSPIAMKKFSPIGQERDKNTRNPENAPSLGGGGYVGVTLEFWGPTSLVVTSQCAKLQLIV